MDLDLLQSPGMASKSFRSSSTIGYMPTVFYREGNATFHRQKDCVQLTKKPARGTAHPVLSADLREIIRVRPCHTCYPDAPRYPKMVRRYCPECNKKRTYACPHNGGLPVVVTYTTNFVGLLRDPGAEVRKVIYVWPDQLYRHEVRSAS